ncbi:MAG: sulfite exporter TauE/SafE family protein, partial [Bacteroidota bacterium]
LRSAFLIRAGLSKEAFIATGVVVACLVDVTRLGVYGERISGSDLGEHMDLLLAAVGCAFLGSFLGSRMMGKVTMRTVRAIVSFLLVFIGGGLAFGIL